MPELPDILLYIRALGPRVIGHRITGIRLASAFLLRSVDPPLAQAAGRTVVALHRLGKRITFELADELFLVFHLMIAGRFRWVEAGAAVPRKVGLLALDFDNGTLILTEAGTKRRASLHLVQGEAALRTLDPGGLEIFAVELEKFRERLSLENHTLKRALTDPRLFAGIGNAYSDEILHAARLSPLARTASLSDEELERLYGAVRSTLQEWTERLRRDAGDAFPDKVTAFRPAMAVHGRYRQPCPRCGAPIQRIRYAENEANYCAACQTGGKVYADRALSRLLKDDWPRSLEEWEARLGRDQSNL